MGCAVGRGWVGEVGGLIELVLRRMLLVLLLWESAWLRRVVLVGHMEATSMSDIRLTTMSAVVRVWCIISLVGVVEARAYALVDNNTSPYTVWLGCLTLRKVIERAFVLASPAHVAWRGTIACSGRASSVATVAG